MQLAYVRILAFLNIHDRTTHRTSQVGFRKAFEKVQWSSQVFLGIVIR